MKIVFQFLLQFSNRAEFTEAGQYADELPVTVDKARYNTLEKSRPVKEDEPLKFGVATPTAGTGTLKRAEVKVADTDSFKGRVARMTDDGDQVKEPQAPYEVRNSVVL